MPMLDGNFGRVVNEIDEDPIEFMFCGEKFTASSQLYGFGYMKFQHQMKHSKGVASQVEDNEAIYQFFRGIFDADEDWQRFQDLILANRVSITELFRLTRSIAEAMAGRPTVKSKPSSLGRSQTKSGRKSKKRFSDDVLSQPNSISQPSSMVSETDASKVEMEIHQKANLTMLGDVQMVHSKPAKKPVLKLDDFADFGEPVTEETVQRLHAIG